MMTTFDRPVLRASGIQFNCDNGATFSQPYDIERKNELSAGSVFRDSSVGGKVRNQMRCRGQRTSVAPRHISPLHLNIPQHKGGGVPTSQTPRREEEVGGRGVWWIYLEESVCVVERKKKGSFSLPSRYIKMEENIFFPFKTRRKNLPDQFLLHFDVWNDFSPSL